MTPRRKRLLAIAGVLVGVGLATAVALKAFDNNLQYFYDPSEVVAGKAPTDKSIRVGGMVTKGSVDRKPGSLEVQFVITDFAQSVKVSYTGVLPDLFREGQGIIAHGRLRDGVFVADEVLAKHDEKYMPPEVAKSLKKPAPPRPGGPHVIPELGTLAMVIALLLSAAQAFFGLVGAHRNRLSWMQAVTPAVAGVWVFVSFAFGILTYSFIVHDFSVGYVATNSNTELPLMYRVAAVWGAHEGSLLLWIEILATWALLVAAFSKSLPNAFRARVLGVLGLVGVGFSSFTLLTSSPFTRLLPAAAEGADLNPILQDPALAIHPPMLYMGYVGTAVAFAFAVAAMLAGRIDPAWSRWTRPWTVAAWMCLTVGIALGSWWAYYELGWGGWWFWDPVENASFMPWLASTALIHSLAVTEKRGLFKNWTLLLAIFAFSLSLLGTFLVRSGVLVSVHAFASDPSRGLFILGLLLFFIVGSLTLYAIRAPSLKSDGGFELVSRESFLLLNNALLVAAAALILIGTLWPLVMDAFSLGKISVGPPYFNMVFLVPTLPLLALVGVGMHASWRRAAWRWCWRWGSRSAATTASACR